jgi:hypothetical protein
MSPNELIDLINSLHAEETNALETLRHDPSTIDNYLKCAGKLGRIIQESWPTLRDELHRLAEENQLLRTRLADAEYYAEVGYFLGNCEGRIRGLKEDE